MITYFIINTIKLLTQIVEFCFICFYFIFFRYSFVFIAVGTLLFPRLQSKCIAFLVAAWAVYFGFCFYCCCFSLVRKFSVHVLRSHPLLHLSPQFCSFRFLSSSCLSQNHCHAFSFAPSVLVCCSWSNFCCAVTFGKHCGMRIRKFVKKIKILF